jgi:hypothetical protein
LSLKFETVALCNLEFSWIINNNDISKTIKFVDIIDETQSAGSLKIKVSHMRNKMFAKNEIQFKSPGKPIETRM